MVFILITKEICILTSFWVCAEPESWSKYTDINKSAILGAKKSDGILTIQYSWLQMIQQGVSHTLALTYKKIYQIIKVKWKIRGSNPAWFLTRPASKA